LREVLGFFTAPFLLFDVSAIISRSTLKEFLTFTRVQVSSKFLTILGILFTVPLLIFLAAVAPLFQGLDIPQPLLVNDKLEQRIRVANEQGDGSVLESPALTSSQYFGLELPIKSQEASLFPDFKFKGVEKKLNFLSQ